MSETPTPTGKPPLGCRLNFNHLWRWEYPPEGRKYGRCVKCGKINDNWVGSNWTESWSQAFERSADDPLSPLYGVRRPTGDDGQDLITEAANAYGEASRAYDELLERRRGPGQQPTDDELKAALDKRDAAERAWHKSFGEETWRKGRWHV